jgi:hypothetical protein
MLNQLEDSKLKMKRLLISSLLLIVIGLATPARSDSKEDRNMTTELQHLNEIWNQAWLEKDAALIEKLMANDYVYIAPNGKVMDRKTILNIIKSPGYRLDNSTRTPILIKPVGEDAAVMVFHSKAAGTFEGKSFKDDHTCTMLCIGHRSEWRVLLEQCSPNNQ